MYTRMHIDIDNKHDRPARNCQLAITRVRARPVRRRVCVAVCCNFLIVEVCCKARSQKIGRCSVLLCVVVRCSVVLLYVLRCVARLVCRGVGVAVCCSFLHCVAVISVAVCCILLRHMCCHCKARLQASFACVSSMRFCVYTDQCIYLCVSVDCFVFMLHAYVPLRAHIFFFRCTIF